VLAELGSSAVDAQIIASELVANSVRHSDAAAGRQIELEVEFDADFVKIEVCDAGSGYKRDAVHRRPAGPDGGFGLLLVAELSDAWGVSGDGGTCAWALLDRTKASPSAPREATDLN
jgi:anti-sigma regulatory factor (Ser/Thr protein kinase)